MADRALKAILPQIANSPYEAHQKARTFASRYLKSKQYDTAIQVLFQSSRELLKNGQSGSGVDLAGFLLEAYEAKGETVNEESRDRLTQLISLIGPEGTWRKTVIDKALAWSAKQGSHPAGDPQLCHYIGQLLYKEGSYEQAEQYLLGSDNRDSALLLAEMYIHWYTATGDDPGAFALRGTLPYLLNGSILSSKAFIVHFVSLLPPTLRSTSSPSSNSDSMTITTNPIVNFCQLAVLTCQRAQGDKNKIMRESWVRLCGTYQSKGGILASPDIRKVLNEIGSLYFSLPPPRSQQANPFGEMMSSLLGGPPGASSGGSGSAKRALVPPEKALVGEALD